VNFEMTLGTLCQECPAPSFGPVWVLGYVLGAGKRPFIGQAQSSGMKMGFMTLETQERLILF
jgi:hypothetical protein